MIKVKICGLTREEDLKAAVDAGTDLIGFVVGAPSSPRNLELSKAKYLIEKVTRSVKSVAVTLYDDEEKLTQLYTKLDTDYIQLHGNLRPLLESGISFNNSLIGAVDANATNALEQAVEYSGKIRSILLDTTGRDGMGGTGITHNWDKSRRIRDAIYPAPLILAGGLTPENVSEAVRRVRPYGVDVSSGVEIKPGIKDHSLIIDFIERVKEATK